MSTIQLIIQTIVAGATLSRDPHCPLQLQRAYLILICYLQSHYPQIDLDRITKQPDSQRGRDYLAEDLANAQADQAEGLLSQVHGLIDALHAHLAESTALRPDLWRSHLSQLSGRSAAQQPRTVPL